MNNFRQLGVEQLEAREVPTVASYVTNLYQEILGRDPDTNGFYGWSDELQSGRKTTNQVAVAFITSDEYRRGTVISYFQVQLGRTPSNAEVQPFVDRLQNGESQDRLRVTFFGSEEFFNKAGRNNTQFVSNLYTEALGRSATTGELNFWTNELARTGGDRTYVAREFLKSNEYYGLQTRYAYVTLLERQPDSGGYNYWFNQRATGMTVETLDVNFLASVEYFNKS
jgi:Domain of unknown function (DUF4214)